jgi:glycosyltransferase involved in cell wall biosynthesis
VSDDRKKVLMISPYKRSQRGNSITSLRIKTGLEKRGFIIDLISLEDHDAPVQIREKLADKNYSLLHAFHALHWGRLLDKLPPIQPMPVLLTTTGTDLHCDLQGKESHLVKKGLLSAQNIVLFHQDFRELICDSYPALGPRLTVIPQGIYFQNVSRETFSSFDFKPDDFIFLFPSGFRPVKNFELTIDALAKIQSDYPNLRLVIIGALVDHDYSRKILQRIARLPWVTYLGEIPHEKVRNLITYADVVVNSSKAEGQPQGALEAMSLGLPCILTAVPGNLHIIEDGREGLYVHNEQELEKAARFFMNNRQTTKMMGRAAQNLVQKNFSMEKELDAYENLYRQLSN